MSERKHDPGRRAFLRNAALGGAAVTVAGHGTRALARIDAPHPSKTFKGGSEVYGFCDMC
jgi:hypothetical protein